MTIQLENDYDDDLGADRVDHDPYTAPDAATSDDDHGPVTAPVTTGVTMRRLLDWLRSRGARPISDQGFWYIPCPYHPLTIHAASDSWPPYDADSAYLSGTILTEPTVARDHLGHDWVRIQLQTGGGVHPLLLPIDATYLCDYARTVAVRRAVQAAGADGLAVGGRLTLTYSRPDIYLADYVPPGTAALPDPVFPHDPRLQAADTALVVRLEQRPRDIVWVHPARGHCGCSPARVIEGWQISDPKVVPAGTEITDEALRELIAVEVRQSHGAIDWHDQATATAWLDEPLIEAGQFVSIYGPAGIGKSLLAQERAGALSRAGRRVLYLDAENSAATVRDRYAAMGHDPASLAGLTYLSFPALPPLDTAEGAARLATLVDTFTPDLVVIDTWSKFVAGDEANPKTHSNAYTLSIMPLRRHGVAVLAIDHSGKNPSRGPRGGSSKVDNVDTLWLMVAKAGGRLRLERRKSRTGRGPGLVEFARHADPLRHERVDLAPADVFTPEVRDVVARLDDLQVPAGWGRTRVAELLRARGYRVRTETLAAAIRARRERGVAMATELSQEAGTGGGQVGQVPGAQPGTAREQQTR